MRRNIKKLKGVHLKKRKNYNLTDDGTEYEDASKQHHKNDLSNNSSCSIERMDLQMNHDLKNELEVKYEKSLEKCSEKFKNSNRKLLLPIKTNTGIIKKQFSNDFDADVKEESEENVSADEDNSYECEDSKEESQCIVPKLTTTARMLSHRKDNIKLYKYKIGTLSSELLENPLEKTTNLMILLKMMEEKKPENYVTIQKLVSASLLEIFKDILPSYNIVVIENHDVKLKKDTFQLQKQESLILKYYKQYLRKLEKMANILRKKQNGRYLKKEEINLGIFAVNCMCDLIISKPYFNFSLNIVSFLVPFLNSKYEKIRKTVALCFQQIFAKDKRGEFSLTAVRHINQYIKLHKNIVYSEIIIILESLRIGDINPKKDDDQENKYKKLVNHRKRILALSKKERKKKNKLKEIEKEMLETKAEESTRNVHKTFTEIINTVFMMYFRILKNSSNCEVLSACLEGLSKFSHCINIDFYQDLLNILDNLIDSENLTLRGQLHCIYTVLFILSGQTAALNIDPNRFYIHLYHRLLDIHLLTATETNILIKILHHGLVHRRNSITQNRMLAFIKRISATALGLHHNEALGIIYILKSLVQNNKKTDILFDTDGNLGDGNTCTEELSDPEHCNAFNTILWEIIALKRHYHPTIKMVSGNIVHNVLRQKETHLPIEILKLSADEVYEQYNPAGGKFKPAAHIPETLKIKSIQNSSPVKRIKESVSLMETENLFGNSYFNIFQETRRNSTVQSTH